METETNMSAMKLNSKIAALSIGELITRYELSNRAEGKSPKTVKWYDDMLKAFSHLIKIKQIGNDISVFNINI